MNTKVMAALATYVRGVLAAGLTALLTVITTTGHFPSNGKEYAALLWAVLLAVLPVVINYLNTDDPRYGRGAGDSPKPTPQGSAAPLIPAQAGQPVVTGPTS